MLEIVGPFVEAELAYRHERLVDDFRAASRWRRRSRRRPWDEPERGHPHVPAQRSS